MQVDTGKVYVFVTPDDIHKKLVRFVAYMWGWMVKIDSLYRTLRFTNAGCESK